MRRRSQSPIRISSEIDSSRPLLPSNSPIISDHPLIRSKSLFSKLLVAFSILASLAFAGFITFYMLLSNNPPCNSPQCVLVAASILSKLDQSVDPCEDFYRFSCGNWLKETYLPASKNRIGTFNTLNDQNKLVLGSILENPYVLDPTLSPRDSELDQNLFNSIQNLYSSCMDEITITKLSSTPLVSFIKQSDLPTLNKPLNEFKMSLYDIISTLHLSQIFVFFQINVGSDAHNPQSNIIALGQGGLTLPSKEYYSDESIISLFKDSIQKTVLNLWPLIYDTNFNTSEANTIAINIIEFEQKLAKISKSRSELTDPVATYNPITIDQLKNYFKPFSHYFSLIFPEVNYPGKINLNTTVILDNPDFFVRLQSIIETTQPKTIEYYFIWFTIQKTITRLDSDSITLVIPIYNIIFAIGQYPKMNPPRDETCLDVVNKIIGEMTAKYFIQKKFSKESKESASLMTRQIKKSLLRRLPLISWIDPITRNLAIEKVDSIRVKIGYPDFIMNPESAFHKYSSFQFKKQVYFENRLVGSKQQINLELSKLMYPVDPDEWEMSASEVNAYYSPTSNEIVFPAVIHTNQFIRVFLLFFIIKGILQSPFYSPDRPMYLNYGSIGAVIGHELTHAFDDSGRKYDASGKLADWWLNSTALEFESKAQCFINQYNQYQVNTTQGPLHVNGNLTLGENLADGGGLQRALEAWVHSSYKANGMEENWLLTGLDYSNEQLFYISYGQTWCSKSQDSVLVKQLRTDPHSPGEFRVNGVLKNSLQFEKTFGCKPKKNLNKCLIW